MTGDPAAGTDWPCDLPANPRLVMWPAPDDLAPFISGYSLYVVGDNAGVPHRGAFEPAWASLRLAVAGGASWRLKPARGEWFTPPQISLFGPSSELVWSESGPGVLVGAGVRPRGWGRLFRQPARLWADRIGDPPFCSAPAAEMLRTRFAALADDEDVARAFDEAFREILGPPSADDAAIARIEAGLVDPAIASVAELTDFTGMSLRRLQRLADRSFGFPPKLLLRRARFLRSLHAMRAVSRRQGAASIDPGGRGPPASIPATPTIRTSFAIRTTFWGCRRKRFSNAICRCSSDRSICGRKFSARRRKRWTRCPSSRTTTLR